MLNLAFHWRKGSIDIGNGAFERRLEFSNHWNNKEARKLWVPVSQRWAFFVHTAPNLTSPLCISQLKVKTAQDRWQLLQVAQPVQLDAGRWFCEVEMAGTCGQPVKEFMVDMDPANALSCVVVVLFSPSLRDLLFSLGVALSFDAAPVNSAQTPKRSGTDAEAAACTPHADLILQSLSSGILLRLPISGKACRVRTIEALDSDTASDIEGPALSLSSSVHNAPGPSANQVQCELFANQVQCEPLHNTPSCKSDLAAASEMQEDSITNVRSVADTARKPAADDARYCAANSDGCQRLKGLSVWTGQLETPVGTMHVWLRLCEILSSLIIVQPDGWIQFWSRSRSKTALSIVTSSAMLTRLQLPSRSLEHPCAPPRHARSSRGRCPPVFSAAL
jgi:hypothetical protein